MNLRDWINPAHLDSPCGSFNGVRVLDDFLTAEKDAGLSKDVREKLVFKEIYGRYHGKTRKVGHDEWQALPDKEKFFCYQQAETEKCFKKETAAFYFVLFNEMIGSADFSKWLSDTVGIPLAGVIDGQTVKMEPHNFSRSHTDHRKDARNVCLVYYTGHQWTAGAGGELVMNRPDGSQHSLPPTSNSLVIFTTSPEERHYVNDLTQPWARYSIVYWLG